MADTSKDELLLGGGIRHIAASSDGRSSRAEVSKFLLAYIGYFNTLNAFIFGNISSACAKEQITATYYCQVEVKVRDRIAAVISDSEIIGRSGRTPFPQFPGLRRWTVLAVGLLVVWINLV